MHTIFHIGDIKPIENNRQVWLVELMLMSDNDLDLNALIQQIREEIKRLNEQDRLGEFLLPLGALNKAEEVYMELFDQTLSDSSNYEKTLEICQKIRSPDHSYIAFTYHNIDSK